MAVAANLSLGNALPSIDDLSLAQQVAQMFVVRASGFLFDHQIKYPTWEPPAAKLRHLIQDLGVGGVILLGGSAGEIALRTQQLQSWAKIGLLMAADIEEGVGQRFAGATEFPPPMALSTIFAQNPTQGLTYAEQWGAITAQEALGIGINWVLAPVVDVNNNPDNPVINVRAFGDNPEVVSQLAGAFIRGAKQHPVLTTAKHFPGHGDTATDSHLDLPIIPHSRTRLEEVELPPFSNAIATGVDAIMSAHLLIPSLDEEKPATLSEQILTRLLRQDMGFAGLVVTDALVMGAIANRYGANTAPILAIEAGADILLMPVDPEAAITAVCEAVKSGRISPARIRASVERIWQAKQKLAAAFTQNRDVTQELAQPQARQVAEDMFRDSQIVSGILPLKSVKDNKIGDVGENISSRQLRNVIVVDDLLNSKFLTLQADAIALPTQLGYTTYISDFRNPAVIKTDCNQPTLLQLFIRGNPFRGSAGLTQAAQDWFDSLLKSGSLQALVIYGSPYTLQQFIPLLPSDIPCIFSYGQILTAQSVALKALFGI